ncbi:hypothetical protein V3C99_018597 [Haemonchus contortus]
METIANRHEMSNSERHDDDLAVFKRKMALFKQYTLPMLKLLDEQGSLKVMMRHLKLFFYCNGNAAQAAIETCELQVDNVLREHTWKATQISTQCSRTHRMSSVRYCSKRTEASTVSRTTREWILQKSN